MTRTDLAQDFGAFVGNRLTHIERKLANMADYKFQGENIASYSHDILNISPDARILVDGLDESYSELTAISERESYKQGFMDALKLMGE